MKRLSIIIISWNAEELLTKCLESIQRYYSSYLTEWEVFVVDNNSSDKSRDVAKSFSFVNLIENKENKGFAYANNQAFRISTGEHVLFLNPDTEFIDQSLLKLFDLFREKNHIGIIGCSLRYPDMSIQPSVRKDISIVDQLLVLLKIPNFFPSFINSYLMKDFDYSIIQRVDSVMGAFMFCSRRLLEEFGGFDERFWIWMEDADLCFNAKKKGYTVLYYPHTRIIHVKGESFAKHRTVARQKMFIKSVALYFKKNYGFFSYVILFPFLYISILLAFIHELMKKIGLFKHKNKDL